MSTSHRYALLDHASTDTFLWHMTGGVIEDGTQVHQDATIEGRRPYLEELLRAGHVELYEVTEPQYRRLSLVDALQVIDDDLNWIPPGEHDEPAPVIYGVVTTDSGDEDFRRERDAHQS
jgi:hypothetical protein